MTPRLSLLALLAVLPVLACSTDDPAPGTAQPTTAPVDGPPTQLQISVDRGDGSTSTLTLTCDPPGGDHPDPEAACAVLDAAASLPTNPLEPVPPDVACTEIYGGPQTAVVEGTIDAEPVLVEFSRVDGCEIDRWDAVIPLLAEPAGAGP